MREAIQLTETTEMIPTLIMFAFYILAAAGIYYMLKERKQEYPFDLIVGFFTITLLFTLAYQWFIGWSDYYNGAFLTITNFYAGMFTSLVAIVMLAVWTMSAYKFVFVESRDVTI
jgi:hypothetical protein